MPRPMLAVQGYEWCCNYFGRSVVLFRLIRPMVLHHKDESERRNLLLTLDLFLNHATMWWLLSIGNAEIASIEGRPLQ
jgi:hypothetical protein